MPRDLGLDQKPSQNDSTQLGKDDDFENVTHEEVSSPGSTSTEAKTPGTAHEDLKLQRFGQANTELSLGDSLVNSHEEEDDSDDEDSVMAHHPIFGMLAGRLGQRRRGSTHKYDKLHPENQALTVANVDECVLVENSAFPEHERCTREKFEYRLTRCPELSLGIFTQPTKAEAANGGPKRKLIAHIVATRTTAPSVTDASMDYPANWRTNPSTLPSGPNETILGHQDTGSTICIHSLAVHEDYQSLGLGSLLLKSYIQRIKDAHIADRLALLAHDDLTKFYGRFGFDNMGPSQATFGGGHWTNMILEFSDLADD